MAQRRRISNDKALVTSNRRDILIATSAPELPNDPIECRRDALRTANIVLLSSCIPIEFERPSLGAVRQQTAQRQANLDAIDPRFRATRDPAAQDMHRQRDDNALVPGELGHQ